jgi:hypothetical protein
LKKVLLATGEPVNNLRGGHSGDEVREHYLVHGEWGAATQEVVVVLVAEDSLPRSPMFFRRS